MTEMNYSETEERIFLAALQEFSRKGRAGTRMQDIADRAGINKALIHYYFRSKDRLYEEVFSFVIRKYFFRMSEVLSMDASLEVTLRTFIDKYIDLMEAQPALPSLLMRDIADGASVFREKIQDIMLPLANSIPKLFNEKINAAVARGEIRREDPAQIIITLMGSCLYFYVGFPILSLMFPQIEKKRSAFVKERKEHLFRTLYHGLKPRPESDI
jgi:TetR/AcrR family transcriptional regulator